ncbi:MAG: ribonuclease HII [Lentisphaerae bacterium]|nr:ribonuclease HII [Lentisphaerota bacterium]
MAGVDEAGRGPLAGPVYAAAVVLPPLTAELLYSDTLAGLTDSKQLNAGRREVYFEVLVSEPDILIGVGWCSAAEVDEFNILGATALAMRRALENLPQSADHALVDGLPIKGLPCAATAIVHGDARSLSIAAASVVAKVKRDRYMEELDLHYPAYGFAANKGYGARSHIEALFRHGPCPEHRRSFRPVQDALQFFPGLLE